MRVNKDGYVISGVAVGTPDYISPEVLESQTKTARYGRECDWWSVGVLLYEMLYGGPPFYDESESKTYWKITNHKATLSFPEINVNNEEVQVSKEAKALITKLLTDQNERLGRNGTEEVKTHVFFNNDEWTWDSIRSTPSPFQPELASVDDTFYFEDVEKKEQTVSSFIPSTSFTANHLPFVGFSFNSTYKLLFGPVESKQALGDGKTPKQGQEIEANLHELDRLKDVENALRNELKSSQRQFSELQVKYEAEIDSHRKTQQRVREVEKEKLVLAELSNASQPLANRVAELEHELREANERIGAEADSGQKLKQQIVDLQQRLQDAEFEKEEVESKCSEAEQQRQAAERDRNRTNEQLQSEIAAKVAALRQAEELTDAKSSLSAELHRVKESLAKAKTDLASLQSEPDDSSAVTTEKLNALKHEVTTLSSELEETRVRAETEHAQILAARRDLDEANRLLQEQKDEAEDSEQQFKCEKQRIDDDLAKMRGKFSENEAKLKGARHLLDAETMVNRILKTQRRELIQELEMYNKRAEDLAVVHRHLESELEALSVEVTQARERAENDAKAKAEAELQAAEAVQQVREQLAKEISELQEQVRAEKAQSEAALADLSQKFDDAQVQIERLKYEKRKMEAERLSAISYANQEMDFLNVTLLPNRPKLPEKVDFKAEYKRKKEDCRLLQKQLKEEEGRHRQEIERFHSETEMLREQLDQEQQKSQRAEMEKSLLHEHFSKESQRIQRLETEKGLLQDQLTEETQLCRRLEGENDLLREQFRKEGQRIHGFQTECEKLLADRNAFQARLKELHSSRSVVSDSIATNDVASPDLLPTVRASSTSQPPVTRSEGPKESDVHSGWLSIPRGPLLRKNEWQRVYAVLTTKRLLLFDSQTPRRDNVKDTIDLSLLRQAGEVNAKDLCRVDAKDIPKILQITYKAPDHQAPGSMGWTICDFIMHKGHSLIKLPTPASGCELGSCDLCKQAFAGGIWGRAAKFGGVPPVLQCTSCQSKFHKEHIDKKEDGVPLCNAQRAGEATRKLYFMAPTTEEQSVWVIKLAKCIFKEGSTRLQQESPLHPSRNGDNSSSFDEQTVVAGTRGNSTPTRGKSNNDASGQGTDEITEF